MKAIEDERPDRYGVTPACWVSGGDATPQKIQEWLYRHGYSGYKFAIVIDCMQDEWSEPEKETPVYFMDTIEDEMLEYAGVDSVERWLSKKRQMKK